MAPKAHLNLRLRVKLALSFATLATAIAGIFLGILFLSFRAQLRQNLRQRVQSMVGIAALQIDGDIHARLNDPADEKTADFAQVAKILLEVQRTAEDIYYIYTMRQDAQGQVVFIVDPSEDPTEIGEIYAEPGPVLAATFSSLDQPVVEDNFYEDEWGTWLSGYAPIYRSDGQIEAVLGIDIAAEQVLAEESRFLIVSISAFGLALLLSGGIGLFMAKKIAQPVTELAGVARQIVEQDFPTLVDAMHAIAQGDLTQSVKIQAKMTRYHSKDEIGDLAWAFNQVILGLQETGRALGDMSANLRKLVGQVAEDANKLSNASVHLAETANHNRQSTAQIAVTFQQIAAGAAQQTESVSATAISIEQVSHAIDAVARGAQEQANAVGKAATITTQITAAIQQVAANSQAVTQESADAAEAAREGVKTVEDTIQGIKNIEAKVGISAQKVQGMGEHSEQIGAIIEMIEEIASQTNLLALNAAIEAARAGEHGKGFAVVAIEVRKLAEKSSLATREIAGLIKGIQQAVTEAAQAMAEGVDEVQIGVERSHRSSRALSAILQSIETVNQQMNAILLTTKHMHSASNELVSAMSTVSEVVKENTASTKKMAVSSNEVTQTIESIASVSEESSAAIQEVSASAEEMNAQVEEVKHMTQSLSELAFALQQIVLQFKLDAGDNRARQASSDLDCKISQTTSASGARRFRTAPEMTAAR